MHPSRPLVGPLVGPLLLTLALGACDRAADRPSPPADSAGVAAAASHGEVDSGAAPAAPAAAPACAPDNAGLTLPAGFCAVIVADSVGGARDLAVAPNGDLFVAIQVPRRRAGEQGQTGQGGILALRDANGDGRADEKAYFGGRGGTGIAVMPGWIYADEGTQVVRYPLPAGQLKATGAAEPIVTGIPTGGHDAHNLLLDGRGGLFVNIGSLTNSCQQQDRQKGSKGVDPCTELETRAGIWRYDANRQGQAFGASNRYATGIRNAMGLALDAQGQLWTTQHGRDQLFQNWPEHFDAQQSAELPAEELMRVSQNDDFGWPYCYYDQNQKKLVLAPEYGGDGKAVGRCAQKKAPVAAFPGHWAPMKALFYTGRQFPAKYRNGAFVSFHGSWNRAPQPQGGYKVVFQPLSGASASGPYETFADGFAGGAERMQPGRAAHRPVGLAQSPDGGIYVADDVGGRIYKIVYTGK